MKRICKPLICVLLTLVMLLSFSGCSIMGLLNALALPENNADLATEETKDLTYQEKLDEVVSLLDQVYVDGYNTEDLGDYLASAAVAATGDRWSYYISAKEFDAYVESNNNAYVGIGVTIEVRDGVKGYTITDLTPNGPADTSGIEIGDVLVAVDGQDVTEMDTTQTKDLVRGVAGSTVSITVERDGERKTFEVVRALVETEVVSYELLDDAIGYIKINNFDANCARDTLAAIEDLLAQDAQGLVFDLRFNPGGRKSELLEVLDYLLPEGPLFRSVDYTGKESVDTSDADCLEMPMAVIVNDDSYSAAEFFAAALQEYDWATVVGTQTCGKGNYQQTFRLSDGSAIAVSTGHYQTPNGVTLTDIGVTPDVVVEVDEDTYRAIYSGKLSHADDTQLQAAVDAVLKAE